MWNHRIVDLSKDGAPWCAIQEVFYNEDGSIAGFCDPCFGDENPEKLKWVLTRMLEDIEGKSILRPENAVGFKHSEVL